MVPLVYWKILLGDLKKRDDPEETMSQTSSKDLYLAGINAVSE
jgi:hypothetical protein